MDGQVMKHAIILLVYAAIYFSLTMGAVWVLCCIIGSRVAAHQRKHQALRKAHDHKVGGVISP
jgi:hypothetical protein